MQARNERAIDQQKDSPLGQLQRDLQGLIINGWLDDSARDAMRATCRLFNQMTHRTENLSLDEISIKMKQASCVKDVYAAMRSLTNYIHTKLEEELSLKTIATIAYIAYQAMLSLAKINPEVYPFKINVMVINGYSNVSFQQRRIDNRNVDEYTKLLNPHSKNGGKVTKFNLQLKLQQLKNNLKLNFSKEAAPENPLQKVASLLYQLTEQLEMQRKVVPSQSCCTIS